MAYRITLTDSEFYDLLGILEEGSAKSKRTLEIWELIQDFTGELGTVESLGIDA